MPPTILLIRHAQALHNYSIHDPPLTELGFGKQCNELAAGLQELELAHKIELIVVSPMRRTLQTAEQGLGWLVDKGVPVILRADWQENSTNPCDRGTALSIMKREWPQFDWSTVDPIYPSKTGLYEFSPAGLTKRALGVREWLRNRPEKVIAVVTHSSFLGVVCSKKYENADFRIFEIGEGEKEIDRRLMEWAYTEQKGGGLGNSRRDFSPPCMGNSAEELKTEKGLPDEIIGLES